ncbi:MAG TPA: hypothetical protein VJM32_06375 [Candidatus Saccharimonadales bacterium]|nr:hypothetical protein [Candidatus Saccharimonadales bacterium]
MKSIDEIAVTAAGPTPGPEDVAAWIAAAEAEGYAVETIGPMTLPTLALLKIKEELVTLYAAPQDGSGAPTVVVRQATADEMYALAEERLGIPDQRPGN